MNTVVVMPLCNVMLMKPKHQLTSLFVPQIHFCVGWTAAFRFHQSLENFTSYSLVSRFKHIIPAVLTVLERSFETLYPQLEKQHVTCWIFLWERMHWPCFSPVDKMLWHKQRCSIQTTELSSRKRSEKVVSAIIWWNFARRGETLQHSSNSINHFLWSRRIFQTGSLI